LSEPRPSHRWACDDEVETVAVRVFARPSFAFDVEWLELAGHVFSLAKSVLRTQVKSYGLRGD
jgi:hypothetical protein